MYIYIYIYIYIFIIPYAHIHVCAGKENLMTALTALEEDNAFLRDVRSDLEAKLSSQMQKAKELEDKITGDYVQMNVLLCKHS